MSVQNQEIKQVKKSTKFNYLISQNNLQKLKGKYENNDALQLPKRNYDTMTFKIQDKNKQNFSLNENKNMNKIENQTFKTKKTKNHFLNKRNLYHHNQSNKKQQVKISNNAHNKIDQFVSFSKEANSLQQSKQSSQNKEIKIQSILGQQNLIRNRLFNTGQPNNYQIKRQINTNNVYRRNSRSPFHFSPYKESLTCYDNVKYQPLQGKLSKSLQKIQNDSFHNTNKTGLITNYQLSKPSQNYPIDNTKKYAQTNYSSLYHPQQKWLINQLKQQNLIIKQQLQEQEYQNELFRQKIYHLEYENNELKNQQIIKRNQFTRQFEDKQCLYLKQIESLNQLIKQIQNSKHFVYEEKIIIQNQNIHLIEENQILRQNVMARQQQIESLELKNMDLEAIAQDKDIHIFQLQKKLDHFYMSNSNINQTNYHPKRRKSLDLANNYRNYLKSKNDYIEQGHYNSKNQQNQRMIGKQHNQSLFKNQSSSKKYSHNRNLNIGKLMNKTFGSDLKRSTEIQNKKYERIESKIQPNHIVQSLYSSPSKNRQNQISQNFYNQLTIKQLNFIDSIKSMYYKINNQNTQDLKILWKWLKSIAHASQSFNGIMAIRDSINQLFERFQVNNEQNENKNKQSNKVEEQWYKILKKLYFIVNKNQSL